MELQLVPKKQTMAYLCRHCRWHGLEPKRHVIGKTIHVINCPSCTATIKQIGP